MRESIPCSVDPCNLCHCRWDSSRLVLGQEKRTEEAIQLFQQQRERSVFFLPYTWMVVDPFQGFVQLRSTSPSTRAIWRKSLCSRSFMMGRLLEECSPSGVEGEPTRHSPFQPSLRKGNHAAAVFVNLVWSVE